MAKIGRGLRRYEEEHILRNQGIQIKVVPRKDVLMGASFYFEGGTIKWVSMKNWNGGD